MSQQFHAWSHMKKSELPAVVVALQDAGVLIGRAAHGAHHRPNFEGNYCIVSGLWNQPLDSSGFFRCAPRGVGGASPGWRGAGSGPGLACPWLLAGRCTGAAGRARPQLPGRLGARAPRPAEAGLNPPLPPSNPLGLGGWRRSWWQRPASSPAAGTPLSTAGWRRPGRRPSKREYRTPLLFRCCTRESRRTASPDARVPRAPRDPPCFLTAG
jgi:hypothetical protein